MTRYLITYLLCFAAFLFQSALIRGAVKINNDYLIINAKANDPLFTTYAAAMERSRFFADKAYFLDYFSPDKPITYSSQYAGELAIIWKINNIVISKKKDFAKPPVVTASFPDMAIMEYEPFEGLHVQETFFVYSSGAAIINLNIENRSSVEYDCFLYPLLHLSNDSLKIIRFDPDNNGYIFTHYESTHRLHSDLYPGRGYPTHFRNLLASDKLPDSYGGYNGCTIQDFYFAAKRFSKIHEYVKKLNQKASGFVQIVSLQRHFLFQPGKKVSVRFVRGVQDSRKPESELFSDVKAALRADIQKYVELLYILGYLL